jgi:hypothetical protein
MKYQPHRLPATVIVKLATLIALTIAFLGSGCHVSKTGSESKSDTASVSKSAITIAQSNENGITSKEDRQSVNAEEWFRLTMQYRDNNHRTDTSINNFITQPSTVIYETGRSMNSQQVNRSDSSWYLNSLQTLALAVDSIHRKVNQYGKTKRSGTGSFQWLIILFAGAGLLLLLKLRPITRNRQPVTRNRQPVTRNPTTRNP